MPAPDSLSEPSHCGRTMGAGQVQRLPSPPAEREVVKSYGGWTEFMKLYGPKAHDQDEIQEAKKIVQRMAQEV